MALPCWNCRNPTKEDVLIWFDMCLCFFSWMKQHWMQHFYDLCCGNLHVQGLMDRLKLLRLPARNDNFPLGRWLRCVNHMFSYLFWGTLSTTHPWSFVQKPGHFGKKKVVLQGQLWFQSSQPTRLVQTEVGKLVGWGICGNSAGNQTHQKNELPFESRFLEVWTFSFRVPGDFQYDFMMIYLQFTVYVEHMIWTLWSI